MSRADATKALVANFILGMKRERDGDDVKSTPISQAKDAAVLKTSRSRTMTAADAIPLLRKARQLGGFSPYSRAERDEMALMGAQLESEADDDGTEIENPAATKGKKKASDAKTDADEVSAPVPKVFARPQCEYWANYRIDNEISKFKPAFKMPSYTYGYRWECLQKWESGQYKSVKGCADALGIKDTRILNGWIKERDAIKRLAEDPATRDRIRLRNGAGPLADPATAHLRVNKKGAGNPNNRTRSRRVEYVWCRPSDK